MKQIEEFQMAWDAFRKMDQTVRLILVASLLMALVSVYMLIWAGGRDEGTAAAASRDRMAESPRESGEPG